MFFYIGEEGRLQNKTLKIQMLRWKINEFDSVKIEITIDKGVKMWEFGGKYLWHKKPARAQCP